MLSLLALAALTIFPGPTAALNDPVEGRLEILGEVVFTDASVAASVIKPGDVTYGHVSVNLTDAPIQTGPQGLAYESLPGSNRIIVANRTVLQPTAPPILTPLVIVDGTQGGPDTILFEQSMRSSFTFAPTGGRVIFRVTDGEGNAWSSPQFESLPTPLVIDSAAALSATLTLLDPADVLLVIVEIRSLDFDATGEAGCNAQPNSTDLPGRLHGVGSRSVSDNDFRIHADRLPQGSFGLFIVSPNEGFIANPGSHQGVLCLTSPIGRFLGPGEVQNSGLSGTMTLPLDLNQIPTQTGVESILPGDTRYFQLWHRDVTTSFTQSNFTSSLGVTFR